MNDILSIVRASVFVMSCLFVCLYVRIFFYHDLNMLCYNFDQTFGIF